MNDDKILRELILGNRQNILEGLLPSGQPAGKINTSRY